jgi:hypothetical protein
MAVKRTVSPITRQ